MTRLIVATLATAAALAPSPVKPAQSVIARRDVGATLGAFAAAVALPAFADDAPAAPPAEAEAPAPVEFPKDWGITSDYYTDAAKVVAHMRLATSLEKGAPNMELIALNCKKEMIDFVSFYRRFTNVSGKQSFSTLYTAINVLAGHYTSYGPSSPSQKNAASASSRSTPRSRRTSRSGGRRRTWELSSSGGGVNPGAGTIVLLTQGRKRKSGPSWPTKNQKTGCA